MDRYQENVQTWDKVASAYQDRFMDMNLYDDTYDAFCSLLQPDADVFEIACGPGNITRYLLSQRPDLHITAIDIAPSMIQLAKANNPTADFAVMDCREIAKLDRKFEGIICGFCMPYLSNEDCSKLIKDCADLLPIGGILYFSAIEGRYETSGYEADSSGQHRMYVYYHESSFLQQALMENGLELLSLMRKDYPGKSSSMSAHIIFIARKR